MRSGTWPGFCIANGNIVKPKPKKGDGEPHELFDTPFYSRFRRLVDWCLEWRKTVIAITVAALALGGTTLVISPLIALMEDQVSKLREQGIRAERIHSGLTRAVSREICLKYVAGELDFLFIAPERLRVAGFPDR